jgi:cyclohexanone monooxygenase
MTRIGLDRPRIDRLSRRRALELAGGATAFTLLQRKAQGLPAPGHYVDHLAIGYLRDKGISRIEARADAEESWVAHVREVAGAFLCSTCSSWYIGANVPGKPRVFMPYIGGFPAYVQKCDAVAANGYEGFALT